LYPYLKTKKPHADVAFRYAETLHKMYRGCPNREHTLIVRDNLRKEIRVLNKRGF